MKTYNKTNFHKHTFCIFKEVFAAEIADLQLSYTSNSGSSYYFTEKGVYRKSNHWGRAANCKWRLHTEIDTASRSKIGFAEWSHFHPINETEKLYFIEVNFKTKTVQYNHKNCALQTDLYLRNASQTANRVKEIRALFAHTKKLTYWDFTENLEQLLQKVIDFLIHTDLSLLQIKQKLQQ